MEPTIWPVSLFNPVALRSQLYHDRLTGNIVKDDGTVVFLAAEAPLNLGTVPRWHGAKRTEASVVSGEWRLTRLANKDVLLERQKNGGVTLSMVFPASDWEAVVKGV